MNRTLDDIEGRYVVVPPGDGVSPAEIHNVPYPTPDYAVLEDGSRIPRIVVRPLPDEYPQPSDNPGRWDSGISFGDLVRTINPIANLDG